MIICAAFNSIKTVRQIAGEVGTAASISTVTRVIRRAKHLKRKKLKKKSALNQKHILARLLFAK